MLTENSRLREKAWENLSGKWANVILMYIIYTVIASGVSVIPAIGPFLSIFLLPMVWAFEVTFLEIHRGKMVDISFLFSGFQQFKRIFCTKFLQGLYTFLWSLLLIVPGIVKAYSYAMTSFILQDDPSLENNAAIEKSMAMMEGHKMKLFLLDLSFLGWIILAILTCCIGFFWLVPYMTEARAGFYEDLKNEVVTE